MTRKNHIKKKNDVKREQCIQERLNFLIEDAIAKSNFFMNNWEINIIEIIIGDIIYDIYLYENNYINFITKNHPANSPNRLLVSLKNGESFKGYLKKEPNYIYFRKTNTKRSKRKNFVNFCKICQTDLNVVETILEEKILEII